MINVNMYEVNETYNMIEHEKLDVRAIIPGTSLLDCVDSNPEVLSKRIYKRITILAKGLTSAGQDIEADFGILIVNKCISVTPIALVGGSACERPEDFVAIAKTPGLTAKEVGVSFIGGYSAPVSGGMTRADKNLILSIPQTLFQTERVCSSANVGSTKTGIDTDAVELMGRIVTEAAEAIRDHDSLGCVKLVVFCNVPNDNPFTAGVFHGVMESEAIINVGVSGPGAVKVALVKMRDVNLEVLCETIKKTAFKIIRVGQPVVQEASKRMGTPFGITNLPLAPTSLVGDGAAETPEEIGLERVGVPGTTAALAILNDRAKKGGVMTSSYVGGLSGASIPVSEDQGMIDAVSMGALIVEKLEAMTCVCPVGLNMIAIPGDTPPSTITGVTADEVATRMVNQKTTVVRLTPVMGRKVGKTAESGGLLGYTLVMLVNTSSCRRLVTRGGRTPAPIRSFKN